MPKFAANPDHPVTELPVMARFAAAAEAGFEAVEMPRPDEHEATVPGRHPIGWAPARQ